MKLSLQSTILILLLGTTNSSAPPNVRGRDEVSYKFGATAGSKYDELPIGHSITLSKNDTGGWNTGGLTSDTVRGPYAQQTITVTKTLLGPQYAFHAEAALAGIRNGDRRSTKPIGRVNVAVGTVECGAKATNTYVGAKADASAIRGHASCMDFKLGVGGDTGYGADDGSVHEEMFGTGWSVGRKTGVSVAGNSIDIDFGKVPVIGRLFRL